MTTDQFTAFKALLANLEQLAQQFAHGADKLAQTMAFLGDDDFTPEQKTYVDQAMKRLEEIAEGIEL